MKLSRALFIIILSMAIILSFTVGATKLTDPATYAHTIEVLDHSRSTVLSLSASSAVASAAISILPNDICTPIAEQLSELSSCFLFILSVIYVEKYILTILGAVACYGLIPLGCSALLVCCFYRIPFLKNIGWKLVLFGVVLLATIPASVWVTDQINGIYQESIEMTIESANEMSNNLFETVGGNSGEEMSAIETAKNLLDNASGMVADIVEQFRNILNRFVEGTAVMIVTNCLIPLLVVFFFGKIIKILFGVQVPEPHLPVPVKPGDYSASETPYEASLQTSPPVLPSERGGK